MKDSHHNVNWGLTMVDSCILNVYHSVSSEIHIITGFFPYLKAEHSYGVFCKPNGIK